MTQETFEQACHISESIRLLGISSERQIEAFRECEMHDGYFYLYGDEKKFLINPKLKHDLLELMKRSMEADEAELRAFELEFEQL
jgi:hypothetical protein